jgi:hypothetical protein
VFISHAHEDAEFAHRLAADLREAGWRVWITPDSIKPSEKWVPAINRGLEDSGVFVVALTHAAVQSGWVKTETNLAIKLQHQGEMRFIPMEVADCRIPLLWTAYQRVSLTGRYEQGWTRLLAELEGGSGQPAAARDVPSIVRQAPASQPASPQAVPEVPRPVGSTPDLLSCLRAPLIFRQGFQCLGSP